MGDIDWGRLFGMALQTVPEPRVVARDVFAFGAPRPVLWQILALELVAITFLAVLTAVLFPVDPAEMRAMMGDDSRVVILVNPLATGIVQALVAVATVWAIYGIGRAFGGTGGFSQALLTVIWLHYVLLVMQLAIFVLGVFAPGLALILTAAAFVMTFWLLSHFIAEMHGFASAGAVFATMMMVMLVFSVVLAFVLALFGLAGPAGPMAPAAPAAGGA